MVRHHHHDLHLDEHPAAMFSVMIGTLAVLMAVLVISVYARAIGARHFSSAPAAQSIAHQR